jgi:hypothetical protein
LVADLLRPAESSLGLSSPERLMSAARSLDANGVALKEESGDASARVEDRHG